MTDLIVSPTPRLDAIMVIARYSMFAVGNVFIAKGWFSNDQWILVTGGFMTAIPPIYAAVKAFRRASA